MRDHAAWRAWIDAREHRRFAYGQHDCVVFAGGAVAALTGRDPLAALPRWRSRRQAEAMLAEIGGLAAAVDTVLSPIPLAMAARGDVVLVDGAEGPFLMVVEGLTLVGPGPLQLRRLPRAAMVQAWNAEALVGARKG